MTIICDDSTLAFPVLPLHSIPVPGCLSSTERNLIERELQICNETMIMIMIMDWSPNKDTLIEHLATPL